MHPRRLMGALFLLAATVASAAQPPAGAWRSALDGYQRFTDAPVAPWKESNDTVGRIGGWRAYAREASAPAAPAAPATAPEPGTRAAPVPSGHEGHHPAGAPAPERRP